MSEPTSEVKQIDPFDIQPNPENPRLLFYEGQLSILRDSIKKNGILVPITVFKKPSEKKYTILDGERRWRCAQQLKLKTIPANEIAPPSRRENILLMFNIHKVREEWELTETALKLEVLMRLLPKDTPEKEIAAITGMTKIRVMQAIRLLRFDKKYIDMTIIDDPSRRIRGEFFSQLEEALEKLTSEDYKEIGHTKKQIIDIMIEKYHDKEFTNLIQEFRTLRKVLSARTKGVDKKQIHHTVKTYLESKSTRDKKTGKIQSKAMSINDVYEKTSFNIYAEEQILKTAEKLQELLHKFSANQVKDKNKIIKTLKKLKETIDEILEV